MNYTNIIDEGILFYASRQTDNKLRGWQLNNYRLNISYYQEVALDVKDLLLCKLLLDVGGSLSKSELGLTLGFDIETTNFKGQAFYKDSSEVEIFKKLLKSVAQWNLIAIEEPVKNEMGIELNDDDSLADRSSENTNTIIRLTKIGKIALERNVKYHFFKGEVILYSNCLRTGNPDVDNKFPYKSEFGISTEVKQTGKDDIDPDSIDLDQTSDLIERVNTQIVDNWDGHIYEANLQNSTLPMAHSNVEIHLYRYGNEYYPLIYRNDVFCENATNILYCCYNKKVKNYKIKKSFYYKLINDENAHFTYNEIITFWDSIEYDEYIKMLSDNRLDWYDPSLFKLIVDSEYCTKAVWNTITRICPNDIIKNYVNSYGDSFDWVMLSSRMDISFILENPSLSWNFITILGRQDIQTKDAQSILLITCPDSPIWDWDIISRHLTIEFVKDNIDNLNVDFYLLTSWLPKDYISLILSHSNKAWNWDYVTQLLSVKQIEESLSIIESHIKITYLLDKIFKNIDLIKDTIKSTKLKKYISDSYNSGRILAFSLRDKSTYFWSDEVISFFEDTGLLSWNSLQYEKGFAQYPFVLWNNDFFRKYYWKLTEEEDYAYVSNQIEDFALIKEYPNFKWNWVALSININFSFNDSFISEYYTHIVVEQWVKNATTPVLEKYFDKLNISALLNSPENIYSISRSVSSEFIKKHISLPWDKSIFTENFYTLIGADPTLLYKYKDRWNWELISTLLPSELVLDYITYPWTNAAVSKAICCNQNQIIDLLKNNEYRINWYIISSCISYPDFKLIVDRCADLLDWDTINQRFSSLYSIDILSNEIIQKKLNWDIVSESISETELSKVITLHPENIDWDCATQRLCNVMTSQMLTDPNCITFWNWVYLSENISYDLLTDNLANLSLDWNWNIVTRRLQLFFILENLQQYQDKWDWETIWENKFSSDFIKHNFELISSKLNELDRGISKLQWNAYTKVFNQEDLQTLVDTYTPDKGYNWDYAYVYDNISGIEEYVKVSHQYIDWTALSGSRAANSFFYYNSAIFDIRIWKNIAKKKLKDSCCNWDFKALTKLDSIQQEYSVFFKIDDSCWDWDYISSFGLCLTKENNGEANLRKFKDKLNFSLLSQREDVYWSEDILSQYIDEKWDWKALSSNPSMHVSIDFLYNNLDKEWDWKSISHNTSIKWGAKKIKSFFKSFLKNENRVNTFDWNYFVSRTDLCFDEIIISCIHMFIRDLWPILTHNNRFIPSIGVLKFAEDDHVDLKTLDWHIISESNSIIVFEKDENNKNHSVANFKFVRKYSEYIDWKILSQNRFLDIYNDSIVDEFKDYLDWNFLSIELDAEKLELSYIEKFKKYLDWSVINNRINYQIIASNSLINLSEYLDWSKVSQLEFAFTKDLLDSFIDRWDWNILLKNNAFQNVCDDDLLESYKDKLNIAKFVEPFSRKDIKVYHFTHMFNVIDVLNSHKILSRDKALELSKLKYDSAGGVVGRTSKAHPFARFYFRPNTPTQFYNECLGWDSELETHWGKSYYSQAIQLGLPKCPIPIFLEFDLREILSKIPSSCYYSNGNLQTNWASVYKVDEKPLNMQMEYLYKNMGDAFMLTKQSGVWNYNRFHSILEDIKDQSQQEFLVKGEFNFSNYNSLRIHCYDENCAEMLRNYIDDDSLVDKIVVGGCFSYANRNLDFVFNDDKSISISSNYNGHGDAYFLIKGDVDIINISDVKKQNKDGIIMYPRVYIRDNGNSYEVYFVDLRARTKEWLVYSNSYVSSHINKFKISKDLSSVIKTFTSKMDSLPLKVNSELFYKNMIVSYHGIGHTTRVLFNAYILSNIIRDISDDERLACYIAAIIHDLGKTSDREGEIHGYNSMCLYKNKIHDYINDDVLCERVLNTVRYHSVEDSQCPSSCKNDIIWKVLKDADALDRSRFGNGCDKIYLRLPVFEGSIGQELFEMASYLPGWTSDCTWDNPYEEIINRANKYAN